MIKLAFKIPRSITVAFSGGVDSVAAVDFLSQNHDVTCAFFHHGTSTSNEAHKFVLNYCAIKEIPLIVGYLNSPNDPKKSMEEHWRDERYAFLDKFGPVVTAHHLDDCVETYIMSALHGKPKVIPFHRNAIMRPFLLNRKEELIEWCLRKELTFITDESNLDNKFMRNYVRNILMPHALHVNPGLHTTVKKIVVKQDKTLYNEYS